MLMNLLLGLPVMALCLLLQSLLVIAAIRYYARNKSLVENPSMASSVIVVSGVMFILVIGNLSQVAIWALLFQVLGEFSRFHEAFYHSTVNFSTLGYGDVVMSDRHKLLGAIEAINGILMIGVSTAALMAAFQDSMTKTINARHGAQSTSVRLDRRD